MIDICRFEGKSDKEPSGSSAVQLYAYQSFPSENASEYLGFLLSD